MTFGLRRVEILSAHANGVTLLILAALIAYEAVRRLVDAAATCAAGCAGRRARRRRRQPRGGVDARRARTAPASTSRAASSTC